MATAGVLKFQFPPKKANSDRPPTKQVVRRRRPTLSCTQCRNLKVSCDRKRPCSRCAWRGKGQECTYVRFASTCNIRQGHGHGHGRSSTDCSVAKEQADLPVHSSGFSRPLLDGNISTDLDPSQWPAFPIVVNSDPLFPRLALDWRLSRTLTGLYNQLSSALRILNNPLMKSDPVQRGQTHWQAFLNQCEANFPSLTDDTARGAGSDSSPSCHSVPDNTRLPGFPFEIDFDGRISKAQIFARYLPPRDLAARLVRAYFDTIEGTTRLFHIPTFNLELERYWLCPSVAGYDWLAQLLAVLALGTRIAVEDRTWDHLTEVDVPRSVEKYLRGASICLAQLCYPFNASLETVRTLCLMVTAKKSGLFSCHERDACGPLLDLALHMSLTLECDKSAQKEKDTSPNLLESLIKKRVWTTVRYMYLQHLIHTGASVWLPTSLMEPSFFANVNDDDINMTSANKNSIRSVDEWTESSAEILLDKSLPLAFELVFVANLAATTESDGMDLVTSDALIRDLLHEMDQIFSRTDTVWKYLQRSTLVVYLRRLLLIVYQLDALQTLSNINITVAGKFSALSATECAISILVQQRSMLEEPSFSKAAGRVVAELFKDDFFVAALTIGAMWTRTENLSACDGLGSFSNKLLSRKSPPSRETLLQGLYWCRELWARGIGGSICNLAVYSMLGKLLDILGS